MNKRSGLPIPSPSEDHEFSGSEDLGATQVGSSEVEEPFHRIVAEHHGWLYRYLYRMTGSTEDTEDLLQETFLRAWRGKRTFQAGRPLKPWLFRIASNVVRDSFRRPRPTTTVEYQDLPDPRETEEAKERRNMVASIQAIVATFSAEDRELYHLRFGEGLGPSELEPILGKSEAAISSAIYRLKKRIHLQLSSIQSNNRKNGK